MENYFSPRIDQSKSIKAMQICYKKSPGPKRSINGKIISRSIVGTEGIIQQAQQIIENRERQQQQELLGEDGNPSPHKKEKEKKTGGLTSYNLIRESPDDMRSVRSQRSQSSSGKSPKNNLAILKLKFQNREENKQKQQQKVFNQLCYKATRRVQDNKSSELK